MLSEEKKQKWIGKAKKDSSSSKKKIKSPRTPQNNKQLEKKQEWSLKKPMKNINDVEGVLLLLL